MEQWSHADYNQSTGLRRLQPGGCSPVKTPSKAGAVAKPSRAGSLELVGGALALDLTNTSSGRGTPGHQEHLRDFDTAMQWVEHARVVTPRDCAAIRRTVAAHPRRAQTIFRR